MKISGNQYLDNTNFKEYIKGAYQIGGKESIDVEAI